MKLSTLWLKEWVNYSLTEKELADQMTMVGLEVDAISPVAGQFNSVVVAKVLSTKPHPNADKLTLCEVDANTGSILQIVCGASNVRPGLTVALAMIGTQFSNGLKIKESKLRGELSQGMLCSMSELGLACQSEGIMELEDNAPIGMDLREYLSLDDCVLDVDLTPNRADCFSILGLAREVAALNKLSLQEPGIDNITPIIDDKKQISLKEKEACAHYCGRIIQQIDTQARTPIWMSERLRRGGIRTLHPVVDVMNYVMLELGQPMHAFDLEQVNGDIEVRYASNSEQLELLDGQKVNLNEKVLIIADQDKPLAMAGIMGGSASAVQAHTQDIFLESAFFNPIVIAGVARQYGLFSDSSQRFERGVDPSLQIKALERATALILSIAGGKPGPIIESVIEAHLPSQAIIQFNTDKVLKLTGLSLSLSEMKQLLENLGMSILSEKATLLEVKVPTYRFDIQQEVDLVEEIIRLHGYNNLAAVPLCSAMQANKASTEDSLTLQLSHWFRSKGYHETISYSFVDPQIQEALYPNKEFMQLLNPISSELSQMRAGLWPGLVASMIYNIHRQQQALKLFEVGVVFDVQQGELVERGCVAGLLMGEKGALNWNENTRSFDFFDLKGDLEALFALLKLTQITFEPAQHEALHPGQSAAIMIHGQPAGWIGVLHPRFNDELDLAQDVVLFELTLASLKNTESVRYKTISKYPQIRRDLSFLVDKTVLAADIEASVRAIANNDWLKALQVFDVYVGKGVPEDKKSLAIALTLQDDSRTLVDAEINSLISAILNELEAKFSILLRE